MLVAASSDEHRALLMQYVAIEWPHAVIREFHLENTDLAGIVSHCAGCDLAVVGFAAGDRSDLAWLEQMRASTDMPPVVGVVEGEPNLARRLLGYGVYCHDRRSMTTSDMRGTLRSAMRERLARIDARDKTAIMDASASRTGQSTHPVQGLAHQRVEVRGYQLLKKLGAGGMSEVYLAQSMRSGPACALKILRTEHTSPSVLDLFIEECTIVAGLKSPFVVNIHDHGVTDDYVYVAMEYIEGGDLRDRISAGISAEDAVQIFLQLARALDVIHRVSIIHGDIKPQNIMFRNPLSLVLVDFGVSRVMETSTVVRAGQVVGTPAYISPEHVLGEPMDGRSDLYSAGVLFFEMLTGRKPFAAQAVDELLRLHTQAPLPRLPRELNAFQETLDRLLAKRPKDRFFSAKELIGHLEAMSLPALARQA